MAPKRQRTSAKASTSGAAPARDPDELGRPTIQRWRPQPRLRRSEGGILLRPTEHASHLAVLGRLPKLPVTRGGVVNAKAGWARLTAETRALVTGAGFRTVISGLVDDSDRAFVHCMAERWWDTTHTFHIAGRELTLTSYDFYRLTGLRMDGLPLPFDHEESERERLSQELLGIEYDSASIFILDGGPASSVGRRRCMAM
ncbi:hypothetical protein L1049_027986 [Liquidambar formosana]|uniref:Aminotransferase-like plant mobile domain-containing protein n=1 Tax=Liquidambar formosana TaxID=63359 RepID=A0AAP0RI33_LIQFO